MVSASLPGLMQLKAPPTTAGLLNANGTGLGERLSDYHRETRSTASFRNIT